ncbi:MAG: hypothetical protein C6I01_05305 [Epsilonproteobacteria bacterium]|nr:hypothetical protein [Campylobacterota bacterium]NPA88802.1 hypothetical protein [Campylobacterota bacterium]
MKKWGVIGLFTGVVVMAIPFVRQHNGATQIANTKIESLTQIKSQQIQGRDNQVKTGGVNVEKGTQIINSQLKSITIVGTQKVKGSGNNVEVGGIEVGDGKVKGQTGEGN